MLITNYLFSWFWFLRFISSLTSLYVSVEVHASLDSVMERPHLLVVSVYAVGIFFVSFAKSMEINVATTTYFILLVHFACMSINMPAESLYFLGVCALGFPL